MTNSTKVSEVKTNIDTSMNSTLMKVYNTSTSSFDDVFVISYVEGLLLKNINTNEELKIITDGVVDYMQIINSQVREGYLVGLTETLLVSLYNLGFQHISMYIENNSLVVKKSKVLGDAIVSTSFVQVNDYIFYADKIDGAKSITAAKYKLPVTRYMGEFNRNYVYKAYDSFKVPTALVNNVPSGEYTYKYTKTAGKGKEINLYSEELIYTKIFDTNESIPTSALQNDKTNDYRLYALGIDFGILIYDYNTTDEVFELVTSYKDNLFDGTNNTKNYNSFIVQDNDYLYYNCGSNLCRLDISDLNNLTREYFDFGEIVNNISIKDNIANVITTNNSVKLNLKYFDVSSSNFTRSVFYNSTTKETDVTAFLNLDDNYVYTELVNNESFLNIIDKTTLSEEKYLISNSSIISISFYNNVYYMIDDKRRLLIFDYTLKNITYKEKLNFNYKLSKNIMYYGTIKKELNYSVQSDLVNYHLNDSVKENDITFDFNNYTPKVLKADYSKMENKENSVINLEISELQYKIVFSKDNLTALYNDNTNILKLINTEDNTNKEMFIESFCFSEDGKLFIFNGFQNKIKVQNFNTLKPDFFMFSECTLDFNPIDGITATEDRYCLPTILKIIYYNGIFLMLGADDSLYVLNIQDAQNNHFNGTLTTLDDTYGYYISNLSFIQDFCVHKENFIVSTDKKILKYSKDMVFIEELEYEEELIFPKLFSIDDYVVIQSKNLNGTVNIDYYDLSSIIRTTGDITYNSGVANIGDRIFFGKNSINEYSLSDIISNNRYNIIDSAFTTSYGINKRLEHVEDQNEVFSLVKNNNTIISYQVPNYDILYVNSNSKIYKPLDLYLFGFENSYNDGYRLLKDIGLKYKLVQNKVISDNFITNIPGNTYRNKKVIKVNNDIIALTDNTVLLNDNIIIDINSYIRSNIIDITANDNYIVLNDKKHVYVYNTATPVSLLKQYDILDTIISIDKSSNYLYVYSKSLTKSYIIDLNTFTFLISGDEYSVDSVDYNNTIMKVLGKRKNINNNDYLIQEPKNLKELNISSNVCTYTIEPELFNVILYIDDEEMTDFNYDKDTGSIIINYNFSGYEYVLYSFLSKPVYGDLFYDKYSKDANNISVSPIDTINGVDIYDILEFDNVKIPDKITKIELIKE